MKPYEYLEHTADVKFRAYGRTLAEAFANAAYATMDVVTDHTRVEKKRIKKIEICSEDEKALLYDFIEQFIVLLDIDTFLLAEVKSIKISKIKTGFSLKAEILGDTNYKKYVFGKHIKAMTYQQMEIHHEKDKVTLQAVVDI